MPSIPTTTSSKMKRGRLIDAGYREVPNEVTKPQRSGGLLRLKRPAPPAARASRLLSTEHEARSALFLEGRFHRYEGGRPRTSSARGGGRHRPERRARASRSQLAIQQLGAVASGRRVRASFLLPHTRRPRGARIESVRRAIRPPPTVFVRPGANTIGATSPRDYSPRAGRLRRIPPTFAARCRMPRAGARPIGSRRRERQGTARPRPWRCSFQSVPSPLQSGSDGTRTRDLRRDRPAL